MGADDVGGLVDVQAALEQLFAEAQRHGRTSTASPSWWSSDGAGIEVLAGEVDPLVDLAVAVRSASIDDARQLLVRGGGVEVVLDIAATNDHVTVRGTVVGVAEPCSVQLLDGDDEEALAVTDPFGEFALLDVVPGRYELVVAWSRAEIVVDIDI